MRRRRTSPAAILAIGLLALLAPAGAAAANVVNGDFESGTLDGWHVHLAMGLGNWFAYAGTATPISEKRHSPVPPPPQGRYAAITDELNADTLILYQDVTLGPGDGQRLSLLAYYESARPIAVPVPETLSVDDEVLAGQRNQQFRIDVMRPAAPLESVAPEDVLRTVFRTKPGDPRKLEATKFSTDLSSFAGQTVRLRVSVAAHEELLNAGVDAISISGAGAFNPSGSGSARFRARAKAKRGDGTVLLHVDVPGPGLLMAKGKGVRPVAAKAGDAGTVTLRLRLSPSRLATLERRRRMPRRVTVAYLPANQPREALSLPVVFRLAPGARKRPSAI